jgi:hypothetical protein
MRTLILNNTNIVANSNNSKLLYTFPGGNVEFKQGQKLALASVQMYYSTFNITAANNNNLFYYTWFNGVDYPVLFPDGYYDADMINNFLALTMLNNTHYLVSATGNFVYFLTIGTNPSLYAIEFNCFNLNQTLATANVWTLPVGATWLIPTNAGTQYITPMIRIPATNFRYVVGFNTGYYPFGSAGNYLPDTINYNPAGPTWTQLTYYTSTQAFTSSFTPQITPLSSFTMTCSLINNNYAVPNNLIYSFAPGDTFGNQFTISPNQYAFINIQPGQYNNFIITFTDQNNLPISIQDPNYVIMIVISDVNEGTGYAI